jgi:hypothetical protein
LAKSIVRYVRRHHLALLALFVALGGTSVAATNTLVPRNSVASPQVVNGSLRTVDLAKKTIRTLRRGKRRPPSHTGAPLAQSVRLTAWTFDPREAAATSYVRQANARLIAIWLPAGARINYLAVPVSVAGAGLTSVELGIYDKKAMDDGGKPPIARTGNIKANFLATGWRGNSKPLGFVAPYSGRYYLASAYAGRTLPAIGNVKQTDTFLIGHLPNGVWTGVHAQAQGTLPNAPASTGPFTNVPIIIAY